MHAVVVINAVGCARVLNGTPGMTFVVDSMTKRLTGGAVVHVRDYRYVESHIPFQIWSIGPEGYKFVEN